MDWVRHLLEVTIHPAPQLPVPVSVNYFPHRRCNYECKFCFHTETSSQILPLEEAKRGLRLLADAGMRKLNISGGEPFLEAAFIGEIFRFSKEELHLESCSIVNNGSKVQEEWLDKYGKYLDIMALSIDSFDVETCADLGRRQKTKDGSANAKHITRVFEVADWCRARGIRVKINSVITKLNYQEDMNSAIEQLAPFRWKVFQVLLLEGENTGERSLRDARDLVITKEQFEEFLERHKSQDCLVPEDNESMKDSYLLLDENMCFLNSEDGGKKPGRSLLTVGVNAALSDAGFDDAMFVQRGGIFEWKKDEVPAVDW